MASLPAGPLLTHEPGEPARPLRQGSAGALLPPRAPLEFAVHLGATRRCRFALLFLSRKGLDSSPPPFIICFYFFPREFCIYQKSTAFKYIVL